MSAFLRKGRSEDPQNGLTATATTESALKCCLPVALLCAVLLTVGCSPKSAFSRGSGNSGNTSAVLSGDWWVTAPNGSSNCCGLALVQSSSSVTGMANPSICGLTTLQGSVTGSNLTLAAGNGALAIDAATSLSASAGTLSGSETCGVTTNPFSATLIGNVTGDWIGIFTATTPNTGSRTNVTINLTEGTASSGTFPALTGVATFSAASGSQSSCLAAATGGTITSGSLIGNSASLQINTTTNNLLLSIAGATNAAGNAMATVSYSLRCGPGTFDGEIETGTGTLSR
jgi:hypothetical protein